MKECNSVVLSTTIEIIKKIMSLIYILGPIIAIVSITIIFIKLMTTTEKNI